MNRSGATRPWQENLAQYQIESHDPEINAANLDQFAKIVRRFGRVYNGFEMVGEEKIPATGPALIVFYHGLVPLDAWYFGLEYYLKTGRMIRALGDNWLFKTPGLKSLVKLIGAVPADPIRALELLESGHLVGVSPGGTREALSGGANNYKLIWNQRIGFAKLAIETGVPIIPAFTQNVEALYRAPLASTSFFQFLYEKTRLPLMPILGMVGPLPFPVKLRTIIGDPINVVNGESAEELAARARAALERLIAENQDPTIHGLKAVCDRFYKSSHS